MGPFKPSLELFGGILEAKMAARRGRDRPGAEKCEKPLVFIAFLGPPEGGKGGAACAAGAERAGRVGAGATPRETL